MTILFRVPLVVLFVCHLYSPCIGQASHNSDFYREMVELDSIFFERSFNRCDITYLKTKVSTDLKFYHDQGGVAEFQSFITSIENNICGNPDIKPIRKVKPNSLEVYPLYNNGELYGAIQTGIHDFYLRRKDKEEEWTSQALFTHVWVLENGKWMLENVLSYNHQNER